MRRQSPVVLTLVLIGDRYVFFLQDERDAPSDMLAALSGTDTARVAGATDGAAVIYAPLQVDQGVVHVHADGTTRLYAT